MHDAIGRPLVHEDPGYSAVIQAGFARLANQLFSVRLDPLHPARDRAVAVRLAVLFAYGHALEFGDLTALVRAIVAQGLNDPSSEIRDEAEQWLERPLRIFSSDEQAMRESIRRILNADGRSVNLMASAHTGLAKNFLDNVWMGWMPEPQQRQIEDSVATVFERASAAYFATQSVGWGVDLDRPSEQLPAGPFPADERAVEFALYRLALAAAQPHSGVSARGEAQIREAIAEALERSYTAALAVGLDASSTSATYVAAEEVIAAVRALATGSAPDDLPLDA